jgi:hypothetical protein
MGLAENDDMIQALASFRQLKRFRHVINSDEVFGTHNRVLSLKPHLRLDWRGQDSQDETQKPDHSASLSDSITSSTRMRFSVHTGLRKGLIHGRP